MARSRVRTIVLVLAGVVLLAIGFVSYFYEHDIWQARERIASGSRVVQTACGPIETAEMGHGPPLLVVHGAGGGFDQGLDFAAPLAAHGFRIVAMSRFGYLRTPLPPDASPAAQADAHACLLDALNIPRAAILGMSAGGPSTLQFAIRHPQRSTALVLVVPGVYRPHAPGDARPMAPAGSEALRDTLLRLDFLFWAAIRLAPDTMTRLVLATDPALVTHASREEQARVKLMREHILPVSLRRLGLLNEAKVMSSLERYPLERIRVPTLAISAQDDGYDTYAAARYTASQIPQARFLGFASGGHLLVGHQPQVMEEIARFLKAQGR